MLLHLYLTSIPSKVTFFSNFLFQSISFKKLFFLHLKDKFIRNGTALNVFGNSGDGRERQDENCNKYNSLGLKPKEKYL